MKTNSKGKCGPQRCTFQNDFIRHRHRKKWNDLKALETKRTDVSHLQTTSQLTIDGKISIDGKTVEIVENTIISQIKINGVILKLDLGALNESTRNEALSLQDGFNFAAHESKTVISVTKELAGVELLLDETSKSKNEGERIVVAAMYGQLKEDKRPDALYDNVKIQIAKPILDFKAQMRVVFAGGSQHAGKEGTVHSVQDTNADKVTDERQANAVTKGLAQEPRKSLPSGARDARTSLHILFSEGACCPARHHFHLLTFFLFPAFPSPCPDFLLSRFPVPFPLSRFPVFLLPSPLPTFH